MIAIWIITWALSFGAAWIIGFFDSIDEMNEVYDEHRGHTGLQVDTQGWKLTK